jgi:hypothetical protein
LSVRAALLVLTLAAAAACQPNTTRPGFTPLPEAASTEVRLPVRDATRYLADALKADSIPIRKVMIRDGYLESDWFSANSKRPVRNRRPLGPGAVRVRAWVDPARPGSSQVSVETSYRQLVDPSLPQRELDRQVPRNHPIALKVEAALKRLVERYGGPPPPTTQPATPAPAAPQDDQ